MRGLKLLFFSFQMTLGVVEPKLSDSYVFFFCFYLDDCIVFNKDRTFTMERRKNYLSGQFRDNDGHHERSSTENSGMK